MSWFDPQVLSLAVMFLTGAGMALAIDLLGVLFGRLKAADLGPADRRKPPGSAKGPRRRPASRRARYSLLDVILWLAVTPLVFAAMLVSNRGEPRFYVFVGLALGAGAYLLLARRFFVWAGSTSREQIIRAGGAAAKGVARPARAASARGGRAARATGAWAQGRGRAFGGWAAARNEAVGGWARGRAEAARRFGGRILGGIIRRPKE